MIKIRMQYFLFNNLQNIPLCNWIYDKALRLNIIKNAKFFQVQMANKKIIQRKTGEGEEKKMQTPHPQFNKIIVIHLDKV